MALAPARESVHPDFRRFPVPIGPVIRTDYHVNSALEGRTYVVVGAGRGIGRLLAEHLAAHGADLVLAARSREQLEQVAGELTAQHPRDVRVCPTDVADHDSVVALADFAQRRGPGRRTRELRRGARSRRSHRPGRRDRVAATRSRSISSVPHRAAPRSLPVLAASGGGSIVNLSGGGIGGPNPPERISAYATAKAGVVVLTEVLGRELAPLGVRVNVVAPGPVATGFMADVLDGGPEIAGAELFERTVAQHAAPEPTDALLALVEFLLSPAAGGVTGRFLSAKWDSIEELVATTRATPTRRATRCAASTDSCSPRPGVAS